MQNEIAKLIGEINILAYLITTKTKKDVFVNFSGHVQQLTINIHPLGWDTNNHKDLIACIDLEAGEYNSSEYILNQLSDVRNKLIEIGESENIDYSELPYEIEEVRRYKLI